MSEGSALVSADLVEAEGNERGQASGHSESHPRRNDAVEKRYVAEDQEREREASAVSVHYEMRS